MFPSLNPARYDLQLLLYLSAHFYIVFYYHSYDGPNYIDPLQRAVHRGSEDLGFVNNPLVIDYVHQKFNCSLPHWASKKLDLASVNGGFYTFGDFDKYKLSNLLGEKSASPEKESGKSRTSWDTHLLRYYELFERQQLRHNNSPAPEGGLPQGAREAICNRLNYRHLY